MSQFQLSAQSISELRSMLGSTGLSVSPRPLRTNLERELYCLRRYLLTLAAEQLLTFPFEVKKEFPNQAPDFMFSWREEQLFGLEVTEATDPLDQREMDHGWSSNDPFYYQGQFGGSGAGGFIGDTTERLWMSYVVKAIEGKKNKLTNYQSNVTKLLLYSNSNAGGHVEAETATRLIGEYLCANPELCRVNNCDFEVSILKGDHLVYDIAGELKLLPVID